MNEYVKLVEDTLKESKGNIISKSRAKAHIKTKIKGKRPDGLPLEPFTIFAIDVDGTKTEIESLNDFNKFSSKVKYEIVGE